MSDGGTSSQASVDLPMLQALFAGHLATPLEDALAVGLLLDGPMSVPPIAAHAVTAIGSGAGDVALSILGTEGSGFGVRRAKVRRFVGIHQLVFVRRPRMRVFRHETIAIIAQRHLPGTVVAIPQSGGHLPEGGHLQPAGFHGARAGEAVALALQSHGIPNGLQEYSKVLGNHGSGASLLLLLLLI